MSSHNHKKARTERNLRKLEILSTVLAGRKSLLIVLQDYPDPDALASAAALRELARAVGDIQSTIACGGALGRSENRALARYLRLNNRILQELDFARFDVIALLDTQPGSGANALPDEITPAIVIDHHPIRTATRSVEFTDIRSQYGATSTILYEYLSETKVPIEMPLATALLYGIRSDTQDLGREAGRADIEAFLNLYPIANKRMLSEIQHSKTPRSYFRLLANALKNAMIHGPAIISCLGRIDIPDIIGEVADLMLRDENISWTLCYGYYDNRIVLSMRTSAQDGNAGKVMHKIVYQKGTGGGHKAMAGGQISLKTNTAKERRNLEEIIRARFLKTLKLQEIPGEKLISAKWMQDTSGPQTEPPKIEKQKENLKT